MQVKKSILFSALCKIAFCQSLPLFGVVAVGWSCVVGLRWQPNEVRQFHTAGGIVAKENHHFLSAPPESARSDIASASG